MFRLQDCSYVYSLKTGSIQVTIAIVSPGRKGVGWETISLIEGKKLKRGLQAVDQRHTQREEERRFHNLIFMIKLCNSETSKYQKDLNK